MVCETVKCVRGEDEGSGGSVVAHAVVEYIRCQYYFPFDLVDLEDDLDGILHYYGIFLRLSSYERELVREGLRCLAEGFEFAEVERLVFGQKEVSF
jgi:hypothetical protein